MKVLYRDWERQFDVQIKKASKDSYKVWRAAVEIFKKRVENKTPVGNPTLWRYPARKGYNPGTLRRSWMLEFRKDSAILENNTPYAVRVEYGWSSQAPRGMLRTTLKEFPGILKQARRK